VFTFPDLVTDIRNEGKLKVLNIPFHGRHHCLLHSQWKDTKVLVAVSPVPHRIQDREIIGSCQTDRVREADIVVAASRDLHGIQDRD